MTSLVAAKTRWEDVVGRPPPGEAALGGRGRSLPSGQGRAGRAWSVAPNALTGWGLALVADGLAVVPGTPRSLPRRRTGDALVPDGRALDAMGSWGDGVSHRGAAYMPMLSPLHAHVEPVTCPCWRRGRAEPFDAVELDLAGLWAP